MIIRTLLAVASLAAASLAVTSLAAQAAPSAPPAPALIVIQGNADAARANAQIYQWKRVNVEVDRIAAAERALELAGASDPLLRAAVLSLRQARQAHDSDATAQAGTAVSARCAAMTR